MKNRWAQALVLLTFLFLGFLCGFFVGRNTRSGNVVLQYRQTEPAAEPAPATDALPAEQATAQTPSEPAGTDPLDPDAAAPSESSAVVSGKVNVNTASAAELMTLPGIGEVLAQRIVDYREANGPFSSLSDLTNVSGIGTKRLEAILDYATVGG